MGGISVRAKMEFEYKYEKRQDNSSYMCTYYKNGKIENERYSLNGKPHREGGPATIYYYENGNVRMERYCINGSIHREDGPAITYYYQNGKVSQQIFYLDNQIHREDGPAIIRRIHGEESYTYYLFGCRMKLKNKEITIDDIGKVKDEFDLLELKLIMARYQQSNREQLNQLIESKRIMFKMLDGRREDDVEF